MEVGNVKQKANPVLVGFVFTCIILTIILLYVMQKTEAVASNLAPPDVTVQY